MRRSDRAGSFDDALAVLRSCRVLRIAVADGEGLYIVPLNFGYVLDGTELTLYFHGAHEGRKARALRRGGEVCFELDCGHRLLPAEDPARCSYAYRSVIGWGPGSEVTDMREKIAGLEALMRHQTGRQVSIDEQTASGAAVFKIAVGRMTVKMHCP